MTLASHSIFRDLFDYCIAISIQLKVHYLEGKGLEMNFLEWKVRIIISCYMRLVAPIQAFVEMIVFG